MNEKERLYEHFVRLIIRDPSILRKILERLDEPIVDAEGRPVDPPTSDPDATVPS